ncbi:MAG TPA: hypothetical protein VJV78_00325 [Polyangiales bacterium]|nr:hypothetical protein [Polyangiales bacterium]
MLLVALLLGGMFVGAVAGMSRDPNIYKLALEHFPAIVGLPSAAFLSLGLVLFLEKTSGHVELEGFGFKFKGAAGPIIMWTVCFLAIASAIKLLW